MKIIMYAVLFSVLFISGQAAAQADAAVPPTDTNPYMDPAFQDYVETAYGYRNPKHAPKFINDSRDALTSLPLTTLASVQSPAANKPQTAAQQALIAPAKTVPGQYYKVTFANENGPISAYVAPLDPNALSGFKAGDYVFITVLPKTQDYAAVISALSVTGFKFAGEKTYFTGVGKKTYLMGWAPYAKLGSIYSHPQVRRVAIEKKSSGIPLRTRVHFTLRAPGGTLSGVFVSDYIRQLASAKGFVSENVFRLPQNSGYPKFTAYDITGSLPVDMVGEISRSPFVAAVEFKDKSM